MKKSKQAYKNYKGISANESYLLSLIEKNNLAVFGVEEVHCLSHWSKNRLYNTLFSLEKKGRIIRIKRNGYALKSRLSENLFRIATEVAKPSYISFWTALSYYGFTEQQVKAIQLVSTKQMKKMEIDSFGIEVVTFQPVKFYGYKKLEGFVIAEPEKALIDSLFQLDKCGGLNEFAKCLKNAWESLNKRTFVDYLIRFNNRSVISRMGYLIDYLKLKKTEQIEKLQKYKSKGFINLNPNREKTREYNKKWNVIINQRIKLEEII
jgi:predicted transcriptional regulator of viral defense system